MSSKPRGKLNVKCEEESGESPAAPVDESSAKKDGKGEGGTLHRTSKLGRKGDPRMHRAVAARLANPDMTLLEALRAGGFIFPDCDEKGGTLDGTICDGDNVQLCQRKNQLSRRLRLARQAKASKSGGTDAGGKGGSKSDKGDNYGDNENELTAEAQDRLRLLIQQTQQRGKAKKRKDNTLGDGRSYKRMLSISAEDEVEVVEEDPYEEEIGADSTARRAKFHPLFQRRQPTIPTTAWGAAAQLGLAGMAAGAAATAQASGQTTAAQQLQQAAAAYGAASPNTTASAALAMAQARGGAVPAAAQHSFSFWPSLAAGGAAAAQRIIQQQQAAQVQAQAQAQAHVQAQKQQQQQQTQGQKEKAPNANGGGGPTGVPGGKGATDGAKSSDARPPSLALTAASLGMSQDQLVAVLGGGGLGAGVQSLQQQQQLASHQSKQQTQVAPPLGVATGAPATGTSAGTGTGGGVSQNISTCSSLSARDQVATALRQAANGPTSGKELDDEGKFSMALDMLRTESASLLKRCMLMAGFEPSQTEECDLVYLEFAERAAEEERQRIARIRARVGRAKGNAEEREDKGGSSCNRNGGKYGSSDAGDNDHQHGPGGCKNSDSDKSEGAGGCEHKLSDKSDSAGDDTKSNTPVSECNGSSSHSHTQKSNKQGCFDGRHVHRLEGKCGHQAVIHQPKGGQPHVDFVVDNKIECYEGTQGVKHVSSSQALWPSKFSCDQLMCESRSDSNHEVKCGPKMCINECGGVTKKIEPKVLELRNADFAGKEWNKESAGDGTLLGLMALGDKTSSTRENV